MTRVLRAALRSAVALIAGAVLLNASACGLSDRCADAKRVSTLSVTVLGDDGQVSAVTASPLSNPGCAPWEDYMSSEKRDGAWLADLGEAAYEKTSYAPLVVELRALDRHGKTVGTGLATLDWTDSDEGEACGSSLTAKETLALGTH